MVTARLFRKAPERLSPCSVYLMAVGVDDLVFLAGEHVAVVMQREVGAVVHFRSWTRTLPAAYCRATPPAGRPGVAMPALNSSNVPVTPAKVIGPFGRRRVGGVIRSTVTHSRCGRTVHQPVVWTASRVRKDETNRPNGRQQPDQAETPQRPIDDEAAARPFRIRRSSTPPASGTGGGCRPRPG